MFELQEIEAGYEQTTVLRGVSVAVPPASVVALLGPNGAGKTTLLRVASGLLRPSAGRVVLDGNDVTGLAPERLARRGICHVPEGRGIFPNLSVRENLLLLAERTHEDSLARAVDAFPILGQRLSQLAGTLSGGEQQMLALARAHASTPRVMLLDEVSIGLAPKVVDEIFAFLQKLAREGASLLLVEQYVTRALEMADYVFMLNRGRLSFAGDPSELHEEDVFVRYMGTEIGTVKA